MATTPVVERHVYHDAGDSSATSVVLIVIAALLIIGFFLFAFNMLPFGATGPASTPATDNEAGINIDTELPTPSLPPTNEVGE